MSRPGKNVGSDSLAAWTSMPTPRTKSASFSMRGSEDIGSRRLRQRVLAPGKCPVEPERKRLDIGALDGGAAPDAQAGRRIAVGIDVVGDAFLLHCRSHALDERGLGLGGKPADRGIDHLQADRGVGADRRVLGEKV